MRRFCLSVAFLLSVSVSTAWAQLPSSYTISGEPPYRNQGSYGTCWTFGTMASVETNIIKEGLPGYNATAGLSERDLAWNSGFLDQIGGGLTGINNGGNYLMSSAYLARGAGPLTDAQAPYSGMSTAPPTGQVAPYYVRDIEWYHNVNDIKSAVMTYGAVATCWQTSSSTQQYQWSSVLNNYVYYDPGPGVPNPGPGYLNQPNHAVAIVGWNDSVQTPGGTGSWIIRNSWGSSTQHFGVSYNDYFTGHDAPDVGAANLGGVSFHNVVANTYQKVYYHNDFGWTDQQPHAYAFNQFTTGQAGWLKSVSFFVTDNNVGYTVKVYKQFQGGALGQLMATVSGTEAFQGFHTIDLPSLICLPQGQNFYVELQTSNGQQANDGNILKQRLLDFQDVTGYANTTALPGESFFSDNGTTWSDLQTVDTSANFAINALTVVAPDGTWKGGGTAGATKWEVAANWDPTTGIPNAAGLTVCFGNQAAANSVVDITSGGKTVGSLVFLATTNTTIQSSAGASLTLDNSSRLSTIDVCGSHTIAARVVLNNDAQVTGSGTVTLPGGVSGAHDLNVLGNVVASGLQVPTVGVASGATLAMLSAGDSAYTGVIRGTGTLSKLGAGKLTLSGPNTFTGATQVKQGTLQLGLASHGVVFAGLGTDVQNDSTKLVFDYTGGSTPATAVLAELKKSYNGGTNPWAAANGGKIFSTTAAAAPTSRTLGWADDGASQVTVMQTVVGDANLDGKVDFADLGLVTGNYGTNGVWSQGDFNYDGVINFADLGYVTGNYGQSLPTGGSSGGNAAVPEPGTLALLAAGLLGLLAYARRKRQ